MRLIKTPRVYLRDTGLLHTLLNIHDSNELSGHPILGRGFEAFVIESMLQRYPYHEASFYRSSGGAEIDLIFEKGSQRNAIEIKSYSTPRLGNGFIDAPKIVKPQMSAVVAPVNISYPLNHNIWFHPLANFLKMEIE